MGRITKTFQYASNKAHPAMMTEVAYWIESNTSWQYNSLNSLGVWMYNPIMDMYMVLGSSSVYGFQRVAVEIYSYKDISTTATGRYIAGKFTTGSDHYSDPTRTCQVTIYDNNGDYVIAFGSYNNLEGISEWIGTYNSASILHAGTKNDLIDSNNSIIGVASALVSNVITPLGSVYIGDVYFGNANAFNDIVVPGLKSYASDQTLAVGKRYTAEGKNYLCLNSGTRLLWEY